MALQGNLDTMSLTDLLQWLGGARKTGIATLSQGAVTKRIFLEEGLVTGSISNDPSDFLGQFLLSYGRITESQLRDALDSRQGSADYLGTHLIRMGAITESELVRMLVLKTEETIYSLFNWEHAHFEYHDCQPEMSPFRVALKVEDILLKGARRYDEMYRIRSAIPSSAAVPRRTDRPLPDEIYQSANLRRLAEAIDGARTLAAIALHTHTSEFLVGKFLFESLRAGLIEITLPPEEARPALGGSLHPPGEFPPQVATDLAASAKRLFDAGNYEGVLALIDPGQADGDETLRGFVRQAEERFVQRTYETHLPPDRVPVLLRTPKDLLDEHLSPEEYFLISRIDGVWDVRSIIAVSPLREVEALLVLRRLQDRGCISLKMAG